MTIEASDANRIRIWKFAEAPKRLRSLQGAPLGSGWVVFVPRAIWGHDIEELIVKEAERDNVLRREMPNGDIVYRLACPRLVG